MLRALKLNRNSTAVYVQGGAEKKYVTLLLSYIVMPKCLKT